MRAAKKANNRIKNLECSYKNLEISSTFQEDKQFSCKLHIYLACLKTCLQPCWVTLSEIEKGKDANY